MASIAFCRDPAEEGCVEKAIESIPAIRSDNRNTHARNSVARLVSQAHLIAQYHAYGKSAASHPVQRAARGPKVRRAI